MTIYIEYRDEQKIRPSQQFFALVGYCDVHASSGWIINDSLRPDQLCTGGNKVSESEKISADFANTGMKISIRMHKNGIVNSCLIMKPCFRD